MAGPLVNPNRRLIIIGSGTAAAFLLAGLYFQFLQPTTKANADQDRADQRSKAGPPQQNSANPPLARIVGRRGNNAYVLHKEVANECMARIGTEVLDSMINRVIIQLACEDRGITVTEAEVHREVHRVAQEFQIAVDEWYKLLISERGVTKSQYQKDIIWPMLALRKLAGADINITPAEVDKAFERHYGPRVELRMILMDNVRRAADVHDKARRNPESFPDLARQYSIEENSAAIGGAIPPLPRHSGNPRMEEVAFSLRKGQISGVIEVGPKRFAILLCEGGTKPLVKKENMKQVEPILHQMLTKEKVQEAVARVFGEVKAATRVDNYYTGTTTGGIRQTSGSSRSPSTQFNSNAGIRKPSARPNSSTRTKVDSNSAAPGRTSLRSQGPPRR